MNQELNETSVADLDTVHVRYNHITELRLKTAYRFIYLSGAALAFVAYLHGSKSTLDSGTLNGIMLVSSLVLAFIGWATTTYDAICRKISFKVAGKFLSITRGNSAYESQKPKSKDFMFLDEESYFFLPVPVLTSALCALTVFAICNCLGCRGFGVFLLCMGMFAGSLWKLATRWRDTFLNYDVINWEPSGFRGEQK
jgi:hypothetical protein